VCIENWQLNGGVEVEKDSIYVCEGVAGLCIDDRSVRLRLYHGYVTKISLAQTTDHSNICLAWPFSMYRLCT